MLVKNLKNSSKCKPPKGSRLDWWVDSQGRTKAGKIRCLNKNCPKKHMVIGYARDGGHVCTFPEDDGFCYIVPLCGVCNHQTNTKPFVVEDDDMKRISETVCKYRVAGGCTYGSEGD